MPRTYPWAKWDFEDWLRDTIGLSLEAAGFWSRLLVLMNRSPRRGCLLTQGGKPYTLEQIASSTGCSTDKVSHLLRELEDAVVYSTTPNGVRFNRRMVRDEHKRQVGSEAGKKGGGSPAVKGPTKGPPKGAPKGPSLFPDLLEDQKSSFEEENRSFLEQEFVCEWNRCSGVVRSLGAELSAARRGHFHARIRTNSWDWRAALKKFPLPVSQGDGTWKPDLDWFLKPDSVQKLLEGKYDWSHNGNSSPSGIGPGQIYQPDAQQQDPSLGRL
jgi:hypothetical protein